MILFLGIFTILPFVSALPSFPPPAGIYTGDYVYITEPGRYTLEHNISHSYPAGIIIAAPSVILDGQGFSVSPADTGMESNVGIWITPYDPEGRPVTGVSIRNVKIHGEVYGVYAEGEEGSDFVFNSTSSFHQDQQGASTRTLSVTDLDVSGNRNGMVIRDISDVLVESSVFRNNDKTGVEMTGGAGTVSGSVFTANKDYGLFLSDETGVVITNNRFEADEKAGIFLENSNHISISDNILDNQVNLILSKSDDVQLDGGRQAGRSIIGTPFKGGNLWSSNGVVLYRENNSDADRDGIADNPFDPGVGIMDNYPLMPLDEVYETPTPQPTSTLTPTPVVTPVSVISGIHAVIIADTIPSEMKASETYEVTMTIYNDGSDEWIPMNKIGIVSLEEAKKWGQEYYWVPLKSPVESKQSYTFTFSLNAPSNPGEYTLKYQAVREASGMETLFGRPYTRNITVS